MSLTITIKEHLELDQFHGTNGGASRDHTYWSPLLNTVFAIFKAEPPALEEGSWTLRNFQRDVLTPNITKFVTPFFQQGFAPQIEVVSPSSSKLEQLAHDAIVEEATAQLNSLSTDEMIALDITPFAKISTSLHAEIISRKVRRIYDNLPNKIGEKTALDKVSPQSLIAFFNSLEYPNQIPSQLKYYLFKRLKLPNNVSTTDSLIRSDFMRKVFAPLLSNHPGKCTEHLIRKYFESLPTTFFMIREYVEDTQIPERLKELFREEQHLKVRSPHDKPYYYQEIAAKRRKKQFIDTSVTIFSGGVETARTAFDMVNFGWGIAEIIAIIDPERKNKTYLTFQVASLLRMRRYDLSVVEPLMKDERFHSILITAIQTIKEITDRDYLSEVRFSAPKDDPYSKELYNCIMELRKAKRV